ncbi:peptidylprolyl isomerase [Bacillus sp. 1NLA3E]|uniref:peptidylprolyl isomerase n=1 Tax=Bacillus sp. 1NLA3E TaxID=666686 RepID=UPI000247F3A0|nr:peptidylprolyl isomerase [Bacillus sp. 1NLA3E]AGK55456.1 peptidyl-prolyl isomerase [Bacillus sp. 1NLA3E]
MKIRLFIVMSTVMVLLVACGTGTQKQESKQNDSVKSNQSETKQNAEQPALPEGVYPQLTNEVQANEKLVEMNTSMGVIKIKLFPAYAPKAVENFVTHSKQGYYDGLTFHRVIKDFMIQGGDPRGNGTGGESIYGGTFDDEITDKLYHIRGALSMANSGPDTNGSQFFIVQNPTVDAQSKAQMEKDGYPKEIMKAYENGGTSFLDFSYTIFGQVIEGMDVVDKIANVETGADDKPKDAVIIKNITVIKE